MNIRHMRYKITKLIEFSQVLKDIFHSVKYILHRIKVFVFHSRYSTIVFGFFSVAVAISPHLRVVVFII